MSLETLRDQITEFTALDAPVGFEEPVLTAARGALQQSCDRVEVDVRGNVYGWQDGTDESAPCVMITAHADEIGFLVTSILPGGFLRFAKLGGPTDMVLPGQRVRVLSKTGPLEGVIGVKPGHILSPGEARQTPAIADLYLDVGARSVEEISEWGIEVGTPAVFVGELTTTRNSNRCFGKCVDNRMGVVSVLAAAAQLAKKPVAASRVFAIVVEEDAKQRLMGLHREGYSMTEITEILIEEGFVCKKDGKPYTAYLIRKAVYEADKEEKLRQAADSSIAPKERDIVDQFLAECCTLEKDSKVYSQPLYEAFTAYALKAEKKATTRATFGHRLSSKGFRRGKSSGGYVAWYGLFLTNNTAASYYNAKTKRFRKEEDS